MRIDPLRFTGPTAPGEWRSDLSLYVTPPDRLHCVPWPMWQVPDGHRWRIDKLIVANWSGAHAYWSATVESEVYSNATRDALTASTAVGVGGGLGYRVTFAWGHFLSAGKTEILSPGTWLFEREWFAAASTPGHFSTVGPIQLTISGLDYS